MLTASAFAADIPSYKYYEPAAPGIKIGTLTCQVDGGWGMLISSFKAMKCTFRNGSRTEYYEGRIAKFGVDLGITNSSSISWAVIAPSRNIHAHDLAGNYAGVSAEATVIAGLGANVLVGRGAKSFALQPVSVQAQSGLNVSAAISSLSLVPAFSK